MIVKLINSRCRVNRSFPFSHFHFCKVIHSVTAVLIRLSVIRIGNFDTVLKTKKNTSNQSPNVLSCRTYIRRMVDITAGSSVPLLAMARFPLHLNSVSSRWSLLSHSGVRLCNTVSCQGDPGSRLPNAIGYKTMTASVVSKAAAKIEKLRMQILHIGEI